jgi:tetratricopeptide (TPR) repeat protein
MLPRTVYDRIVVVGSIKSSGVEGLPPGLAEFVLKRALSQDSHLQVYDEDEYKAALRLEAAGAREAAPAGIDDARRHYQDALRIDDNYALAHNHLGYCYAWEGDHPRAREEFARYVHLDGSANAWDSVGDGFMHAGDYAQAGAAKQKALELDPNLYFSRRGLGSIVALTGRYGLAERILAGLGSGVTEHTWYLARLAFIRLQTGQLSAAADACAQGLSLLGANRNDAPADELQWVQGLVNVRQALDSAGGVERRKRLAEAQASLVALEQMKQAGQLREFNKQVVEAEKDYHDAIAYNPHYALAHFHLGRLLLRSHRVDEGRQELGKFLDEWSHADPDVIEVRDARRMLAGDVPPPDSSLNR